MLISTLAFTVMNSIVTHLTDVSPFQIVFFRCIGTLVICFSILKIKGIYLWGNQRALMIGRGIVGLSSMILFFFALKLMPFGATVSFRYLAPIFAGIFAMFLLKEKILPKQWLFFLMSFGGVILIKGFDPRVSTLGLILVLASALLSGMVYIFLRAIGSRDHPVVIVFYFMLLGAVVSGILCFWNWRTPQGIEWPLLITLGYLGYLGQLYMTKAFQVEEANKVAPLKYMEAIFSIISGWLFFSEAYTLIGIMGIILVLLGMFLNLRVKNS